MPPKTLPPREETPRSEAERAAQLAAALRGSAGAQRIFRTLAIGAQLIKALIGLAALGGAGFALWLSFQQGNLGEFLKIVAAVAFLIGAALVFSAGWRILRVTNPPPGQSAVWPPAPRPVAELPELAPESPAVSKAAGAAANGVQGLDLSRLGVEIVVGLLVAAAGFGIVIFIVLPEFAGIMEAGHWPKVAVPLVMGLFGLWIFGSGLLNAQRIDRFGRLPLRLDPPRPRLGEACRIEVMLKSHLSGDAQPQLAVSCQRVRYLGKAKGGGDREQVLADYWQQTVPLRSEITATGTRLVAQLRLPADAPPCTSPSGRPPERVAWRLILTDPKGGLPLVGFYEIPVVRGRTATKPE